jgi:DEAD/DEAH box helicase domain-containing protein
VDVDAFLKQVIRADSYSGQTVHVEALPERPARYAAVPGGLSEELEPCLLAAGVERLYVHQAAALATARQDKSMVIVTGTASGKTLCYVLPVFEQLLAERLSTMLFIYPTKALAQDQLRGLAQFQQGLEKPVLCGTYDGDTSQHQRRTLRDKGNLVLTNPDMLHQGILPQHPRWARFFTNLRYVVVDEVHTYRGVFGSHLANVLRRLRRICAHYGATPQFICSSATIANPQEHAASVCGCPMTLIDDDGSPRGPKHVVLWNPPLLRGDGPATPTSGERRSALGEAVMLMTRLVQQEVQSIAFVRTRLAAELLARQCRDRLARSSRRLAGAVQAYRGGYLPEDRRKIEQRLADKEILGVASTNALELGIDIGTLDAALLVGYPGTIASLWQQVGRAGRTRSASLAVLIAQNAPVDQYLMQHSSYLLERNPESAIVDPDNPHIIIGHLQCAAHELPLLESEVELFGEDAAAVLELLEEDRYMRRIQDQWFYSSSDYPSAKVDLRNMAGPVYTIQDTTEQDRVIGTMDELSALTQLHTHAVYLHGGDTYFVDNLDVDQKIAFVSRQELDYYTQSVQNEEISIQEKEEEQQTPAGGLGFGQVTVTTHIPMFRKTRFGGRDSLGFENLDLPTQQLDTVACWFVPDEAQREALVAAGLVIGDALAGLANVLVEVVPLFVMCDPQDIGAVVDLRNLGTDALFLHDRYPGGIGYALRCMERFGEIAVTMAQVVRDCPCESGCPSCVGSAVTPATASDLSSSTRGRIPDKEAARVLLEAMLAGIAAADAEA